MGNAHGRRRRTAGKSPWRRQLPAVGATAAALLVILGVPGVHAAFSGTSGNSGNAFTTAASFPDYPSAVVADSPQFYYRLNDAAGAVTATDSSGNSMPGVYGNTSSAASWAGLWPMDEGSGSTANDRSGVASPRHLTLSNATWTASGRTGSALSFNGTSAYAATASSVTTTSGTFTVAAWVYLSSTAVSRTAVSQNGSNVSAFELGYDQSANRWVFAMRRSDSAAATIDQAASTTVPALNTWTHLTGTFDSSTGTMRIFVNGTTEASTTFGGTAWNATGALEVGAGLTTSRTRYWQGNLDDVRVYTGSALFSSTRELVMGPSGGANTHWQFDENTGSTAADKSGGFNTGTLGSTATWGTAHDGTSSIGLPGDSNGYVAGATSGVNTSTSFTVSAWVYLDHTTLGAMSRVALSQSGSIKSGFIMRYSHYATRWEFLVTQGSADDYSATYDYSATADNSAALTTWYHLVGVHDATAQTVTLYVNGVAQTAASHTSVFNATGALQVGRVKEFGAWQTGSVGGEAWGPWAGRVDEVRVFRRALDAQAIKALYNNSGNNAVAGTTLGVSGALQGAQQGQTGSTAQAYSTAARNSYNPTTYNNPTTYSVECWFRAANVSLASGRTLISFGNRAAGNSTTYDRRLFLDTSGRLVAGTASGTSGTAQSSGTYVDSAWHHAVATVSPANGIKLYVDGSLVASATYAAPGNYTGYWRWGGDISDGTWPTDYFSYGQLDEVAVYNTELTAQQVARHYYANH